jgi:hypothetical protein
LKAGLASKIDMPGWLSIIGCLPTQWCVIGQRLLLFTHLLALRRQNQFVQLRQPQFVNPACVIDFQFTHLLEQLLAFNAVDWSLGDGFG